VWIRTRRASKKRRGARWYEVTRMSGLPEEAEMDLNGKRMVGWMLSEVWGGGTGCVECNAGKGVDMAVG
jgi:hypothetical protein